MTVIVAVIITTILTTAAGFHIYWGCGGQRGWRVAVPEKIDGTPLLVPSAGATIMVAIILLGILVGMGVYVMQINLPIPRQWLRIGMGMLSLVFLARGLSWHSYFGLFKKVKATAFGRNDTLFYSPACIAVGIGFFALAWEG